MRYVCFPPDLATLAKDLEKYAMPTCFLLQPSSVSSISEARHHHHVLGMSCHLDLSLPLDVMVVHLHRRTIVRNLDKTWSGRRGKDAVDCFELEGGFSLWWKVEEKLPFAAEVMEEVFGPGV